MGKTKATELEAIQQEDQLEEVQQPDQQAMMQQLLQMQKQLDEKMAALEAREAALKDAEQTAAPEVEAAPVVSKAWEETRTIYLERARGAEQNFVLVGVNGQQWKVPRGRQVEVPLPLWERLTIMQEQVAKAYEARQRVTEAANDAAKQLMRVR